MCSMHPNPCTIAALCSNNAVHVLTGGAGQGGSDEEGQGPKKGLFGLPFMARAQVRKAWLMSY